MDAEKLIKNILMTALITIPLVTEFVAGPFVPKLVGTGMVVKEVLAVVFAVLIILIAMQYTGIKFIKNFWINGLMLFIVCHHYIAPNFKLMVLGQDIAGFWVWQPICFALIYYLFFATISSINFSEENMKMFFRIIVSIGCFSSIYLFIQKAGLDQFQQTLPYEAIGAPTEPDLTATYLHPTFAAGFLSMCLPLALYLRWKMATVMIVVAVVLTKSMMAIGACIVVFVLSSLFVVRKLFHNVRFMPLLAALLICLSSLAWIYRASPLLDLTGQENGRVSVWRQILLDAKNHPLDESNNYALTGNGIGSYRFIFTQVHKTRLAQAHNEYLEFFNNTGLIGLSLLIVALMSTALRGLTTADVTGDALLFTVTVAFIATMVLSCGTMAWQIEPHRFYAVFFLGLLHGKLRQYLT